MIDARGKYSPFESCELIRRGVLRVSPSVNDWNPLHNLFWSFTRSAFELWQHLYKKSLRYRFAGGFAPHKPSYLFQKLRRNMTSWNVANWTRRGRCVLVA